MKHKPLGDNILVKSIKEEVKTIEGIVVPDIVEDTGTTIKVEVIEKGLNQKENSITSEINIGDTLIIEANDALTQINYNAGDHVIIVPPENILAKLI